MVWVVGGRDIWRKRQVGVVDARVPVRHRGEIDLDEFERRARTYRDAFPDALIAYAYKANANLAVLRHLVALGIGADVVSGGELWRALKVGTPSSQIVFNGNGKTPAEIAYAIDSDVLCINVDSAQELELVAEVARAQNKIARISFRVNPDIDPQTHPYISTGLKQSKFGVPIGEAEELYLAARAHDELQIVGVHCHIGSQITSVEPFAAAMQRVAELVGDDRVTVLEIMPEAHPASRRPEVSRMHGDDRPQPRVSIREEMNRLVRVEVGGTPSRCHTH